MSTEYIHFTAEQKETARQTDLVALLQSQGEHLKRSGKEYVWRDGSEKVTVRGNLWFHQYERIGGDAVDFVRRGIRDLKKARLIETEQRYRKKGGKSSLLFRLKAE